MHIMKAIARGAFAAIAVLVGLLVGALVTIASLGFFAVQRLRGRRSPVPRMTRTHFRRSWKPADVIEVTATEVPPGAAAEKHEPVPRG
jgi:hypothetical protein